MLENEILSTADEIQAQLKGVQVKQDEPGKAGIEIILKAIMDKVCAIDRYIRLPQGRTAGHTIDAEEWKEYQEFKKRKLEYMERVKNERQGLIEAD